MATKYQLISQLAEHTLKKVSTGGSEWLTYLKSAAHLYRYPFHEQILIYAQRPDAIACATFDMWNTNFKMRIKNGAKGIALIDDKAEQPRLKHVFDISDTNAPPSMARPYIWKMKPEYEQQVRDALINAFGETEPTENFEDFIKMIIDNAVQDNGIDYLNDFLQSRDGSLLEELDEQNADKGFHELLLNSVGYTVLERLGLEPEAYYEHEDFRFIFEYNTPETISILGNASASISDMVLQTIGREVKSLDRQKFFDNQRKKEDNKINKPERSATHGDRIQDAGGLPDTRPEIGRNERELRKIRDDAQNLPEKPQIGDLSEPAAARQADGAFSGYRPDGEGAGGTERGADAENISGSGQSLKPDGLGSAYEQPESTGGGNGDQGTDLQLTKQNPTSEKAEDTANADESPAFLPSMGLLPQQTIDEILTLGSNFDGSKLRICYQYKRNRPSAENVEFLRNEYKTGGKGLYIGNTPVSLWFSKHGIHIGEGESAFLPGKSTLMTWEQADKRIRELFELGRYMPQSELDKVDAFVTKNLAETFWYLHSDISDDYESDFDMEIFRGGFPKSTEHIAQMLTIPDEFTKICDFLKRLSADYAEDRDVMRFHLYKPQDLLDRLYESQELRLEFTGHDAASRNNRLFITQDEITTAITGGSNISQSKFRIYTFFTENHTAKEKADFLKNEYGLGGSSHALSGASDSWKNSDGKGLQFSRGSILEPYAKVTLPWSNVAKRIDELIQADKYLSEKEKEALPGYQLEQENLALERAEREYARSILSTAPSEKKEIDRATAVYDFSLGDTVYLGGNTYDILSYDDSAVLLYDHDFPIINKEMARDEFDRLLRDTPSNDGLIVPVQDEPEAAVPITEQQSADSTPPSSELTEGVRITIGDRQYIVDRIHETSVSLQDVTFENATGFPIFRNESLDYVRELWEESVLRQNIVSALNGNGFAVSNELVEDGIAEYRSQGGKGNYEDIADFIEQSYLTEDDFEFDESELADEDEYAEPDSGDITEPPQHLSSQQSMEPAEEKKDTLTPTWQKDNKVIKMRFDLMPTKDNAIRHNYHITDDTLGHGTAKVKYQNNVAAIRLLKNIESEERLATPEEQEILAKYVGWGGLAQVFDENNTSWTNEFTELRNLLSPDEYTSARSSTLNAHYTSPTVIKAMYKAIGNMGFKRGNILEPACGTGNFFGTVLESMTDSKLYGVEIDSISGSIAKQLYQKASISVQGFETTDFPDSFFDVGIGNVPFGSYTIADKRYDKHKFYIHDYFIAKTLDKVRPGGMIAIVTSKGTLDKTNPAVRKYIAQRAELLGAIRLPNNAFLANAGTEVTADILFFQKRDRTIDIEPEWVHLSKTEDGIPINSYFAENPEMVLGTMVQGKSMYGNENETTCEPFPDADLAKQLDEAIQNIHGDMVDYELDTEEMVDESIPADPDVRNFSFTIVDGEIYFRENSRMNKVSLSETAKNRIKGMVQIRECVRELILYQTEDYGEETILQAQRTLNKLYDNFTKKYGLINSRGNSMAFSDDSAYALLCSLEILNENGELERKADMFTKRTIRPHTPITHVDTAVEALGVSMGERACVDMEYMCALTGLSEEKIRKDLEGVIFLNPIAIPENAANQYLTADEYLSGDVRQNLELARRSAELYPKDYTINVKALEAVQPTDLTASEIDVRLGTTWIPTSDVRQFVFELLDTPYNYQSGIDAMYSPATSNWNIKGKSFDRSNNIKARVTYGTNRVNAYEIIEESLNLRDVRIFDTVREPDGSEKRVLNKKETAIAQQKQEAIKEAFKAWIWKDHARRERLVKQYNIEFNSSRPREYNGEHIKFVGMNPEIKLRDHQKNAVARALYGGNTLLAHCVGAGKTYAMTAIAMEAKRLGLCHKSMIAVPNHLTEQIGAEFLQLYPSANILVATKKDFEPKNRKKFCARIATGDYDAIVIGHSQFEKIPVSTGRQIRLIEQQIDEILDGISELKAQKAERYQIKQLERTRKSLEARLKKLNDTSRKDDVVTFEELGIDKLFVDEADEFKNLFLYTKMRNVAGISQTDAQKSSDMFAKCQYMDEITDGKGIVFATGTPISNSMTELYTMQRYLQYRILKNKGLSNFDAWASTFGETVTSIELAPEGTGYRAKTRFARFYNLPELMAMFKEAADIQTEDMLNLPTPTPHYHNVSVKPSEFQKEKVAEFSERADAVRKREVEPNIDNMLKITNDGRKLALDQRLVNPMFPDYGDSKVNACVDKAFEIWEQNKEKRLTQLLFCDLSTPKNDGTFNVYDDIRTKLMHHGVPEDEIEFIHNANTDIRKKELFAKVRKGQVRILMGSTAKMGAGTNVQTLLYASHDLDCPWRPRDLTQRGGRTIRQGNQNPDVHIYRYVTENTFDSYMWQILENKQKFIGQIMTGKSPVRSCEDVDDTALSYAEIKALATGNPYIKEKMSLDIDVSKLKMLKANHQSQIYSLEDSIMKHFPMQIKLLESRIAAFEQDLSTYDQCKPTDGEKFAGMTIKGVFYSEKEQAGKAILEACKDMTNGEPQVLGEYIGFPMEFTFERDFKVSLKGQLSHTIELGTDIYGNITRLNNALESISGKLKYNREQLTTVTAQLETAKQEVNQPFEKETELQEKTARLAELNALLNMDDKTQDFVDAEPEPEQPGETAMKRRQREMEMVR